MPYYNKVHFDKMFKNPSKDNKSFFEKRDLCFYGEVIDVFNVDKVVLGELQKRFSLYKSLLFNKGTYINIQYICEGSSLNCPGRLGLNSAGIYDLLKFTTISIATYNDVSCSYGKFCCGHDIIDTFNVLLYFECVNKGVMRAPHN